MIFSRLSNLPPLPTDDGPFLRENQALYVLALPATAILSNGLLVLTLKALNAPVAAYGLALVLVPAALFCLSRRARARGATANRRQWALLIALAAAISAVHLLVYGTAVNNDATLYFSHPLHSFFASGVLSFSEAPFITFGDQPVAKHWALYTTEYPMAALAWLLNLRFESLAVIMHLLSNLLLWLGVAVLVFRFAGPRTGSALVLGLALLIYSVAGYPTNFAAMGVFRGFENKGLIFGFYFWAVTGLFIANRANAAPPADKALCAALIGASACLVSPNAPVLLWPAAALAAADLLRRRPGESVLLFWAFAVPVLLTMAVYFFLPGADFMANYYGDQTPRGAKPYARIADALAYPVGYWLAPALGALVLSRRDRPFAAQIGLFILVGLIAQSEWFYRLAVEATGHYSHLVWRVPLMFNPLLPIVAAAAALAAQMSSRWALRAALAFLLAGGYLLWHSPPRNYYVGVIPPAVKLVAASCAEGTSVLTIRGYGAVLPVAAPSFRLFSSKYQYLNWQIANLPKDSPDRARAIAARNAAQYLDGVAKFWPDFASTVRNMQPDVVLAPRKAITPRERSVLAGYDETKVEFPWPYGKQRIEQFSIFSRPGRCRF